VIADLYNADGVFIRSAVVADVGRDGIDAARRYCDRQNAIDNRDRISDTK
jgi:hypothetical protein